MEENFSDSRIISELIKIFAIQISNKFVFKNFRLSQVVPRSVKVSGFTLLSDLPRQTTSGSF